MSVTDIDSAWAALRAGRPEELLGLAECGWLDVKGGIYRLDEPGGAEELAKDVAGFANTRTGGLLLVGFSTRKEHDSEILDQVRPVPRALVDLDRCRKLIRERVTPAPREVSVEWVSCGEDKGVLVIDVPAQPPARLPHVVAGPGRSGDAGRVSVAVPVREADATVWLPQAEIQRLLAAGWIATGGPSEEFLSGLIQQAVSAAQRESPAPQPGAGIGEGEPGWKGLYHQAWNDLMSRRIWIGTPDSAVLRDGPGVVQHFESVQALFGWILCALPHRRPVALTGEIWQALQAAAAGALGGDPLGAIGFPAPDAEATRVVDADATSVDLTGGQWGDGTLLRDSAGTQWRWEPAVRFSMNMTRAATTWTGPPEPQLRLRAIATLPWAQARDLAITPQRRRDLEQDLLASALAGTVAAIPQRRDTHLRASDWVRGPHNNSLDRLSYSSTLATPQGQVVMTTEVMTALPTMMSGAAVTCAELRIDDFSAWAQATDPAAGTDAPRDLRMSIQEVADFLAAAWQIATERLPATTGNPGPLWAYPPTIEFRLTAERALGNTSDELPALDDYVRLESLGQTDRGKLREMAVTIITPPLLTPQARRTHTRDAIAYMAQNFGFLDATEDQLQPAESRDSAG